MIFKLIWWACRRQWLLVTIGAAIVAGFDKSQLVVDENRRIRAFVCADSDSAFIAATSINYDDTEEAVN